MKAKLKECHSPDVDDLQNYAPSDPESFGFLLQLFIGPDNQEGSESFDVVVCTPKWFFEVHMPNEIIIGRHHLIVFEHNYDRIMQTINSYLEQFQENTWSVLAQKIARLGKWEFEDYVP